MTNEEFNEILSQSYKKYLETHSRSNQKLLILHGNIASDLATRLGNNFQIKSLGYGNGKEGNIEGRYINKNVDIAIYKNNTALGGIAVKYVMSNYSQNSNNYFENMLGETANLRCNGKAYFQIVVLPKYLPYYDDNGLITKLEEVKSHHVEKYIKLSNDNDDIYMHTPNRTLLCVINLPQIDTNVIRTKQEYINYLLGLQHIDVSMCLENYNFGDAVIYNDYNKFIEKVVNYINYIA